MAFTGPTIADGFDEAWKASLRAADPAFARIFEEVPDAIVEWQPRTGSDGVPVANLTIRRNGVTYAEDYSQAELRGDALHRRLSRSWRQFLSREFKALMHRFREQAIAEDPEYAAAVAPTPFAPPR